ncbi:MAG: (4Fe-4S)-binding protein, partial [Gammaproteobacteria bacterium]|nr:(4Fe-4S)-binding protein [Gammaproteobacteria bacterium]
MSGKSSFEYPGERATVSWDGKLCIHIGECGRATGELFVGGRKPWCQPDAATDDEVEEVVLRCPTGALSVRFADGTDPEKPPAENTLNVAYNGPLF